MNIHVMLHAYLHPVCWSLDRLAAWVSIMELTSEISATKDCGTLKDTCNHQRCGAGHLMMALETQVWM